MQPRSQQFKANVAEALQNRNLQSALGRAKSGFVDKRRKAIQLVPEFEQLREQGKAIKEHTLQYLDVYLERFEAQVRQQGGHVHWASTPEEATQIVVDICRKAKAKKIAKGKSMAGEEIALNDALQDNGFQVIETDLGEYIIQLAQEPPSHIIAPAVHKTKEEISELFYQKHQRYGLKDKLFQIPELVDQARQVLRQAFLSADVGITGANFLIAETGSNVIVTNEGNGDLSCTLPRVHIVTAGIEKVVPSLEDASTLLRLLGRSATGQEITSYTTFSTGPRRSGDMDGPQEYHVVLIDNGRSDMLGNEFQPMLRCIRCGACLNHCPVYGAVGGHAYGWVYPGPMGSVLTPLMIGLENALDLPNACTLNGRCGSVCPVHIPLPSMLRSLRYRAHQQGLGSARSRWLLNIWAFIAQRPRLYHKLSRLGVRTLAFLGKKRGALSYLPFAGGWTHSRDLPVPEGKTFQQRWQQQQKQRSLSDEQ